MLDSMHLATTFIQQVLAAAVCYAWKENCTSRHHVHIISLWRVLGEDKTQQLRKPIMCLCLAETKEIQMSGGWGAGALLETFANPLIWIFVVLGLEFLGPMGLVFRVDPCWNSESARRPSFLNIHKSLRSWRKPWRPVGSLMHLLLCICIYTFYLNIYIYIYTYPYYIERNVHMYTYI